MTDDSREEDKKSAEASRLPQTHFAEARLTGEGGFPIAEDKIKRKGWRHRYVTDNSDIGKRPGRPSAKAFVLERAEQELKAGYSGTKWALAEKLSAEVKQHYRHTDQLTMHPDNVEDVITLVWQRFRGDAV